jgi:tetratricopeptide (TPR) repeat protein
MKHLTFFALFLSLSAICWAGGQRGDGTQKQQQSSAQAVEQSTPRTVDDFLQRGNEYYENGDYDRAIADYTSALSLLNYPRQVSGTENLQPFYVLLENRAFAYINKNDYDRAIENYTALVELPWDVGYNEYFLFSRGMLYFDKGDYDRAIADYSSLIDEGKGFGWDKDSWDGLYVHAFHYRALSFSLKSDNDRAIADYNEVIRLDPNHADAYNNRGFAYALKGNYDQAIADANTSLRIRPNVDYVLHTRGYAYLGKRDYDRAISDFEAALQINPNYDEARQDLERARRRGR